MAFRACRPEGWWWLSHNESVGQTNRAKLVVVWHAVIVRIHLF